MKCAWNSLYIIQDEGSAKKEKKQKVKSIDLPVEAYSSDFPTDVINLLQEKEVCNLQYFNVSLFQKVN